MCLFFITINKESQFSILKNKKHDIFKYIFYFILIIFIYFLMTHLKKERDKYEK